MIRLYAGIFGKNLDHRIIPVYMFVIKPVEFRIELSDFF